MHGQVIVWDAALGRERAASVAELAEMNARRAAPPMLPGGRPLPPPKTPAEQLAAAMAEARAYAADPSLPASTRRQLARTVRAYDDAQRARAEQAELRRRRADRIAAKRAEARAELERAGCYSTPSAVSRYIATGERRERPMYHDSIGSLYASSR